jgi:hypothetical protein
LSEAGSRATPMSRSLLAEIASGTESLLTLRWRAMDSNY